VGDVAAARKLDEAEVGRVFREESGRSVAALIRVFGDIDVAEDAVQDAFAVALRKWPADGLPPNPGAWITTTARNRAVDRLRRESRGRELLSEAALLSPADDDHGSPGKEGPVHDDRLRLIFTCCHPALSTEAQVALTLRLLGGASTKEVARSFLVTPSSTSSTTPGSPLQPTQISARRRSGLHGSSRRSCPTSQRWPAYWRSCS
jgi:RNA polymerase sigma-70 factor (ECF subfamily)